MASLPVMSEVFSPDVGSGCFGAATGTWPSTFASTCASGMTALPFRKRCSALSGDLQHLGNLLLVLPAVTEAVGTLGAVRDLRLNPALVALFVLPPHLPLAGVIRELGLVYHGDAVGHRADRLAYAAAAARLHVSVVEALGRDVEAGVRALQPAERALDAGVEVHHRPHGAGSELLEGGVPRRLEAAHLASRRILHLMAPRDAWNVDALAHLRPLGQHELVWLLRIALRGLHRDDAGALVGTQRGGGLELAVPLVPDRLLDRGQAEQLGQDLGDGTQDAHVGVVVLVDPEAGKAGGASHDRQPEIGRAHV